MKPRFHHVLIIQHGLEIHRHLCGINIKNKSQSHSLHLVHNHEHFWNPSRLKFTTPQPVIISERTVSEICGNSHEIFEIVNCSLSQISGQQSEQDHHSQQIAIHFPLPCEYLFTHHLTVLHLLHFGRKPSIIHYGF
jgi:hypothetical protein